MTKESAYELQKIDCNCNDCKFLIRDISRYKFSEIFHTELQKEVFDRDKNNQLFIGYTFKDNAVINKALRFRFMPERPPVQFGYCKKFDFKQVSFMPGTCQLNTQHCFIHRKD